MKPLVRVNATSLLMLCARVHISAHTHVGTQARPPTHLRVPLVVVLLRADPAAHQVVAHRVGQRKVVVALGGNVAVLGQREVQMPVEVALELGHILQAREAAHRDLLSALVVTQRLGHGVVSTAGSGAAVSTGYSSTLSLQGLVSLSWYLPTTPSLLCL